MIQEFKKDMLKAREMSHMSLVNNFIGIKIIQIKDGAIISIKLYAENL